MANNVQTIFRIQFRGKNNAVWLNYHWRLFPNVIETEIHVSLFGGNIRHWLHRKLTFWQLPVQPVNGISSAWHFHFSRSIDNVWRRTGDNAIPEPIMSHLYYITCDDSLLSPTTEKKLQWNLNENRNDIIDIFLSRKCELHCLLRVVVLGPSEVYFWRPGSKKGVA